MPDKEAELLKYSKELINIQEDGNEHSYKEFFTILDKIKKLIDPNFTAIPADLKKSIGMATVTAVAAPDPEQRVDIVRAGLVLLRTAVILAGDHKRVIISKKYWNTNKQYLLNYNEFLQTRNQNI